MRVESWSVSSETKTAASFAAVVVVVIVIVVVVDCRYDVDNGVEERHGKGQES